MKKQLLVLMAVLISLISYCQIPTNNLIENATLINTFPYTDNNVRLDLATASSISPTGCPVGNYNLVYYKFTASQDAQFEVTIEDSSNGDVGTAFAIIFSAPSLNVNDETQLTTVSPCGFSSNTYVDTVEGTNYYILVHRNTENASSNITFNEEQILPVPTSERDALIALYNSTNGDSWTNNTNWNSSEPVANWYGIRTTNVDGVGHVEEINLGGNNLTGTLPAEIGDFPELINLGLWGNQITGNIPPEIGNLSSLIVLDITPNTFSGSIPDEIGNLTNLEVLWLNHCGLSGTIPVSFENLTNLKELYLIGSVGENSEWSSSSYSGDFPDLTSAPLEILRIQDNFFTFNDIADEYDTYVANIPDFVFQPQFTSDPPEDIATDVGENITLTITDESTRTQGNSTSRADNIYEWFKDDVALPNSNATSYTITNVQGPDSGIYHCEITNPDLPGYVVRRSDITLDVGGYLSTTDITLNNTITIYPNPTEDYINIKLPETSLNTNITVFNILGKKIREFNPLNKDVRMNLTNLKSGIYLITIKQGEKTFIKKIIKK